MIVSKIFKFDKNIDSSVHVTGFVTLLTAFQELESFPGKRLGNNL